MSRTLVELYRKLWPGMGSPGGQSRTMARTEEVTGLGMGTKAAIPADKDGVKWQIMVSVVEIYMDMLQDLVWRSQSEKLYGPNEGLLLT